MKVILDFPREKDWIVTRKADGSGRIAIGKGEFAGKIVTVAILGVGEVNDS